MALNDPGPDSHEIVPRHADGVPGGPASLRGRRPGSTKSADGLGPAADALAVTASTARGPPPTPPPVGYRMRVIVLDALVVPCPTGVKPPCAARVNRCSALSRLRPARVSLSSIFALPLLRSRTLTVATSILW